MKLRAFFFLIILLCAAQSFAAMSLWFKDGTSIQVYKVVFQGDVAEVTLMDGNVRKIPVNQLDLPSSGIFKPVGTYGGKGSAPVRIPLNAPPPEKINFETRQKQLKEEWDRAEKKAVALVDSGQIRRGDIVHIVTETRDPEPQKKKSEYSDYYYTPPPPPQDDAYVIIYRTPDGAYNKKLFDAATFARDFQIQKDPEPRVSMPVEPRIPEDKTQKPMEKTAPAPVPAETKEPAKAPPSIPQEQPSSGEEEQEAPVWPILLAVVIVAVGTVTVVALRRRPKGFINSSKFAQYEEELRDFEVEIWLKHGKTLDQLIDVCVKKFYADQPGPLSAIAKLQKGLDKNGVVAFIAKQGNMDPRSAERVHSEMMQRLDWIRTTIQAVSQRTGLRPKPETSAGAPTGIMASPIQPPAPVAPPVKSPPPPPSEPEPLRPPTGVISYPGSRRPQKAAPPPAAPAVTRQTDLPPYLENVLRDLAMLSDNREE